jgi:hypothetical protein
MPATELSPASDERGIETPKRCLGCVIDGIIRR